MPAQTLLLGNVKMRFSIASILGNCSYNTWQFEHFFYRISACKLKAKYAIILLHHYVHVWLDSSQLTCGNNVIYSSFKYWIHLFNGLYVYFHLRQWWMICTVHVIDTSLSHVRRMPVLQWLSCVPEDRMENWIVQQLLGPYNARFTWYIRCAAGIH